MRIFQLGFAVICTVAAVGMAGCNGSNSTSPQPLPTVASTSYTLQQTITFPGVPPAAGTFSFDISFVDTPAGQYYLADRNTKGVDVISTSTLQYLLTAGAGSFQGPGTPGPGGSPAVNGGPNGVVPVGNAIVFAGDGNSTMKVVNVVTGALVATIPAVNPYTGPAIPAICGAPGTPTTGAANARVDEMAFDPTDNIVLGINDAACPPFGIFYSAVAPYAVLGSISFSTATGGAEQPAWDPAQHKFIMALPSTVANPGGEIDLIDPQTHLVTNTFPETSCNSAGTALGKNETLFLGCGSTAPANIVTMNATTGHVINTIPNLGGCDEVWYNPGADRFYAACSNNPSGPKLVIADGNGALLTTVASSTGAHSVAVDANTDHVFVPQRVAPNIGVTVFGH